MKEKETKECYCIKIPVENQPYINDALSILFKAAQSLYNESVAEVYKRLDYLKTIPEYNEAKIKIAEIKEKQDPIKKKYNKDEKKYKEDKEYIELDKELSEQYAITRKYYKEQHLSSSGKDVQTHIVVPIKQSKPMYNIICSPFYASISNDLAKSIEKYLYGNGKKIHFKSFKKGEVVSCLYGARTRSDKFNSFGGIYFNYSKEKNRFYITIANIEKTEREIKNGKTIIKPIMIPLDLFGNKGGNSQVEYIFKNLAYACDISIAPKNKNELRYFCDELASKLEENKFGERLLFPKVGAVAISCEKIRGEYRYYAILNILGKPFPKYTKEEVENVSTNIVGIDIGPQVVALSFRTKEGNVFKVDMFELAELIDNEYMRKLKNLDKAMERSRRINNPNNFNPDKTAIKGKREWVKTENYKELKGRDEKLNRNKTIITKVSHAELVKYIMKYAHNVVIEPMNFPALAKRSTKSSTRTVEVDGKQVERENSKKRYGGSIGKKSPALFINILKKAVEEVGGSYILADTWSTRASQYNHQTNEYVKKDRSTRWNDNLYYMGEEVKIQRDLYSAFLLSNLDVKTKVISQRMCEIGFDDFVILHNYCLEHLDRSSNGAIKNIL